MQTVFTGDNLHEMSKRGFLGKNRKKYFKMSSTEFLPGSAKHFM